MTAEFQHLTQSAAAEAVRRAALAVLPVGAVEAHGDHLPLGTDNILAERLARRYAQALAEKAVLLPTLPYGPLWSTEGFPGSLPIARETLVRVLLDLAHALARQGVSILAVVNGHYGNRDAITEAARTLKEEGLLLLGFTYPGSAADIARLRTTPPAHPAYMHACEIETSFMLALAPEHVDLRQARANYPTFPPAFDVLPMRWHEFTSSPVLGDPGAATAAMGEAILNRVLETMLALTHDVLRSRGPGVSGA